ncbi:MAG: hypothetical protein ACOCQ3_02055 [Natronomonas sp.]
MSGIQVGYGRVDRRDTYRKVILAVGFLAFAIGTTIAWQSPATGYEVSLYTGTPGGFWIGISFAFVAAGFAVAMSSRDRIAGLAILLGLLATVAVGSLPVIRSYRFFGLADSLTHLGWADDLVTGRMTFTDLFYPGSHSTSALLAEASGVPLERGLIVFAALALALFTLSIPLIARALVPNRRVTAIAAFSGFMLLPINTISNGLQFHTYSLATLFFPVFLFALVKHLVSEPKRSTGFVSVGAWNVVLAILGLALVFIHPQLALNVVIMLGVLVGLHLIYRNRDYHFVSNLRHVYGLFLFMALCWVVWAAQFDNVFYVGGRVLTSVQDVILGIADPGETVGSQTESAETIDVSIWELLAKLFLVPTVYAVLAFLIVIRAQYGPMSGIDTRARSVIRYFGAAGLVLGPFILAHYMGPISHLFFRHTGFVMVFVAVLGAITIHRVGGTLLGDTIAGIRQKRRGGGVLSSKRVRTWAKLMAVGLLSVALALSLLTAFQSPYIYKASHHVSDQHVNGYETAIEHRSEDVQWSGIRNGPGREFDALTANDRPPEITGAATANDEELGALLTGEAGEDRYLAVSEADREREVTAYRELRYTKGSLESVGNQPGAHHVQDNGELDLFYIGNTPTGGG